MKNEKKIGICMDHSSAHLMEVNSSTTERKMITSKFNHQAKEESLQKGEFQMHKREQHQQLEYYKDLAEIIRNYDQVLLFGPTEAKVELNNILKEDHLFANIKIEVQQTDKMTENQQHAFVREYFEKH